MRQIGTVKTPMGADPNQGVFYRQKPFFDARQLEIQGKLTWQVQLPFLGDLVWINVDHEDITWDFLEDVCSPGDRVTPKTPAGVATAQEPHNGVYEQRLTKSGVFRGEGVVVEIQDYVIDYDTWPDLEEDEVSYQGIGKVPARTLLVRFDGGLGWVSQGAVNKLDS